jgi:hypothetical protein
MLISRLEIGHGVKKNVETGAKLSPVVMHVTEIQGRDIYPKSTHRTSRDTTASLALQAMIIDGPKRHLS